MLAAMFVKLFYETSQFTYHNDINNFSCTKGVVPNRGSMDPQGFTEGFLGVHDIYINYMYTWHN